MRHSHLVRLSVLWTGVPVYFITVCCRERARILASPEVAAILVDEWHAALRRHGWAVGAYLIMPDHVHFFCAARGASCSLSQFVGRWKEWTSKQLKSELGLTCGIWQAEFFDHVLRSEESYTAKREYVWQNPVRAGLVASLADWPYCGSIVHGVNASVERTPTL
jgi:REP element-mobilizing transposase RayT